MDLAGVLTRMPRVRKQATHELVASVLREAITAGHLRGNEPLPQDEIAAQLDVSHIPVREALRQLQSEGLVTYQQNRGASVAALTPEEIREIYEIRAILETAAITQACADIAPEKLERAVRILAESERTDDPARWGSLDVEFHELIYALEGRPRLHELIAGLLRRVDRYWLSHGLMLRHRSEFEQEHRALLGAVAQGDAVGAGRCLQGHLAGASRLLIAEMVRLDAATPSSLPGA